MVEEMFEVPFVRSSGEFDRLTDADVLRKQVSLLGNITRISNACCAMKRGCSGKMRFIRISLTHCRVVQDLLSVFGSFPLPEKKDGQIEIEF